MQKISYLELFLIFIKIGAVLLGGGYVILPILTHEFYEKRKLIEKEDLINYYSIAQTMPGIIAINTSIFIGNHLKGKRGGLLAMIGLNVIPIAIIISIGSILGKISSYSVVQGAFWGVGVAVIMLIIANRREIFQNSQKDIYFYTLFVLTILLMMKFNLSPIQTIIILLVSGVIFQRITNRENKA